MTEKRDVTALPLDNEREEDIGVFVERLRELAEDWRYSDELIGLVVRRRWPQRYDQDQLLGDGFPYHPDRDGCECERLELDRQAECVYEDPCWISRAAFECHDPERQWITDVREDMHPKLAEPETCRHCAAKVIYGGYLHCLVCGMAHE